MNNRVKGVPDYMIEDLCHTDGLGIDSADAKLTMVDDGFESFEEAFYPYVVMPNNHTVYEETQEAVSTAYRTGKIAPLLPVGTGFTTQKGKQAK